MNAFPTQQVIGTNGTSSPVAVPRAGQLLYIQALITAGVPAATDTAGGTWTLIAAQSAGFSYLYTWYRVVGLSEHWTGAPTVAVTGGGAYLFIEFDGWLGTPTLDLNSSISTAGATTLSLTTGQYHQTKISELVVASGEHSADNGGALAVTSTGGTSLTTNLLSGNVLWAAYGIVPNDGGGNGLTATWTNSVASALGMASFYDSKQPGPGFLTFN